MYTTNVYVPWGYINLTVNYLLQQFRLFELYIYTKTIYRQYEMTRRKQKSNSP